MKDQPDTEKWEEEFCRKHYDHLDPIHSLELLDFIRETRQEAILEWQRRAVEILRACLKENKKHDYFYGYTALGAYELAIQELDRTFTSY